MPKSLSAQASKSPTSKASAAVDIPARRAPRGERRKRETHARLLDSALRLMAEKGMEGVAINEITEAADVGFGSFYNHFESKEAIYAELVNAVFEEFGDALDRLVQDIADPAEIIAVCVRQTVKRSQLEPVWGKFLIRDGFSNRMFESGLGKRLLRDIERSVLAKRFPIDDMMMMCASVGGVVLGAISLELLYLSRDGGPSPERKHTCIGMEELPERTAASALRALGLAPVEAEAIARRPLPNIIAVLEPA